jgi:alkylhydroperoxidase family enzyme
MHSRELKKADEADERIFAVAASGDAPYFTDAERAALAFAESVTRLSDRPDPVSDEIWQEAAHHYDEAGLASLILTIAAINVWKASTSPPAEGGPWTVDAESRAA